MKREWISLIITVALVITNIITAAFLVKAHTWDLESHRMAAFQQAIRGGTMWAMIDFRELNPNASPIRFNRIASLLGFRKHRLQLFRK